MSEAKSEKPNESPSIDARLAGLESWAHTTFDTKNPVQIPDAGRKWIADNLWWIVIIGGIVTLISALGMWQAAHYLQYSELYRAVGYTPTINLGFQWYILLLLTIVEGAALLVASSKLKQHQKSGWNILFYLSLVGAVFGLVAILTPGYGFASFIGAAIGIAISWTILMQVRSSFK